MSICIWMMPSRVLAQAESASEPAKITVCGDGTCEDSEKSRCSQDCGGGAGRCGDGACDFSEQRDQSCPLDCSLTTTFSGGANSAAGNAPRYVPRTQVEELQKQVEYLKANPDAAQKPAAPTGPSVCGDGSCDDSEKGSCAQDCGGRPSDALDNKIHCGDGDCDAFEQREKSCPLDCNLTDY